MFLLLALIVQIVQIHGELSSVCDQSRPNYDFGNDYLKWIWVPSLRECQRECESTVDQWISPYVPDNVDVCFGITWVKNGNRNCALYNSLQIESGVSRSGQDSYVCSMVAPSGKPKERKKREESFQTAGLSGVTGTGISGGVDPDSGSSSAGISDAKTGGGIGSRTSKCREHFCEARNGSGKCCLRNKRTRRCPKSCD